MTRNRNLKNKVLIKSEVDWGGLIEAVAGFLFFGVVFIYLLISSEFKFQIGFWFVLALFGGISAYCILTLRYFKQAWVYSHHIEIKTLSGNIIHSIEYSDIKFWRQYKYGMGNDWNFTLTTRTKKVIFKSNFISNFSEIANYLEKTLGEDKRDLLAAKKTHFITIALGLGLIFFGALIFFHGVQSIYKSRPNLEKRLVTFDVILNEKPTQEWQKKGSYLLIKTQTHPKLRFIIDEFFSQSDYVNVLREYNPNQTAKLTIYETDYKKYISKETPISFWDKQANFQSIQIYGLLANNTHYLNPTDAIEEASSWVNRLIAISFSIFSLLMAAGGVIITYAYFKNNYCQKKS